MVSEWRSALFFGTFLLSLLLASGSTFVMAESIRPEAALKGDYFLSLQAQCAASPPPGFNPDLSRPVVTEGTVSVTTTGVLRYNGDGTAKFSGNRLFVFHAPTAFPIRRQSVKCDAPYSLGSNRSFAQKFECVGDVVAGGSPAVPVGTSVMEEFKMEGQIGRGKQTLVLGDSQANIEMVNIASLPNPIERICGRTATAQKVGRDRSMDD